MHLCESLTGGKAISPLIAVSLSTCTYESSQKRPYHTRGTDCSRQKALLPQTLLKLVVDNVCPNRGVPDVIVNL